MRNTYNTILATKVAKEQEKMANLPPVRSSVTVEFEFSERNFPGMYLVPSPNKLYLLLKYL